MNFDTATTYLLSLGNEVETMKLGLENITTLLLALGDPQTNYRKVQVAGTNGKGSVCAFLDSICGEAGIRRGLYTSPHLVSITERIRIDGVDICEEEFARLATRVREMAEALLADGRLEYRPTFFEQVTAIALLGFAEAKVELAILETGLGGRYDAVTAAKAEIAAITRIDLDHQEYLGDTIEEIAAEKAAIIGPDTKVVVVGAQCTGPLRVVLDRCREFGVTPRSANKQVIWQMDCETGKTTIHDFDTEPLVELGVTPGLAGQHQIENADTAIMVAGELVNDLGFEISEDQVRSGIQNAEHPGRLEYIDDFLLDGAHNPGGAKALRKFLEESEQRPITLIFGSMRDKAVAVIAEILWPRAETVILTRPSNSRAMTADELAAYAPAEIGSHKILKTESVAEAIEKGREITPRYGLIVVTGSLYLVGEVKKLLNN